MTKDKQRELEDAVADGDWKRVYEIEHDIEWKESKNLIKGLTIGYVLSMTGVIIGGVAVYLIKSKG
jgi:hypothetical protein